MIFQGVATAMVTPFRDGGVDYAAVGKLIDAQIAAGIDALVISGTTGEAPTISPEEKDELFRFCHDYINGRVPFIAGTGTNNTVEVIRLCEIAMKAGADAFLINNPYYNKSSDDGILASYEAISREVDRPIIVYNVPSRTGKNISASLGLALCEIPHVEAFKEANGDFSQMAEFMSRKPAGVAVYSGNDDHTLITMALGGHGVISTVSNLVPAMMVAVTRAFLSGDLEGARKAQYAVQDIFQAVFIDVNPIPLKTAMGLAGMCLDEMRLPLVPLKGAKLDSLKAAMRRTGFDV